jgi:hypothetical protein
MIYKKTGSTSYEIIEASKSKIEDRGKKEKAIK